MPNRQTISLEVTSPDGRQGRIEGFRFLWAFYVNGYDPEKHCQPCFRGSRVPEFCTPTAMSERRYELDQMHRYPFLYICGVASGKPSERHKKNLHLPLRYEAGNVVEKTTHSRYRFRLENAALVHVPAVPDDFDGKARAHARCKNFQFGVAVFGYPSALFRRSTRSSHISKSSMS